MEFARGKGEAVMGRYCLMGIEFQFCKMKRVLQKDGAYGLHNHMNAVNTAKFHLTIVKIPSFMLCKLYHNKRINRNPSSTYFFKQQSLSDIMLYNCCLCIVKFFHQYVRAMGTGALSPFKIIIVSVVPGCFQHITKCLMNQYNVSNWN